ncbi:hypothetical protein RNAN_3069 [Rheinheimera nanhaiensis E407-8]|uniref:Uncharacterized protein n=1 Tax=Rheinheimera nanhaiensis E407-8 TaxID=562729 RepID=I1E177_9GAMM|nr:hypothetical protein RNAN_3069 [Rheinheimera nanhaiensis E407-8]
MLQQKPIYVVLLHKMLAFFSQLIKICRVGYRGKMFYLSVSGDSQHR